MNDAELDHQLRDFHRTEAAPPHLARRILARAQEAPQRPWLRRHAPLAALGSALLAVIACFALFQAHQRQIQTRRAQQAQARLRYALQITTGELGWAENRIHRDMAVPAEEARP